jgi:hypothetical protein
MTSDPAQRRGCNPFGWVTDLILGAALFVWERLFRRKSES